MNYRNRIPTFLLLILAAPSYSMENALREIELRKECNRRLVGAAQTNDLAALRILLPDTEEIACVNAQSGERGLTPLIVASEQGHDHAVEFLLGKRALPNIPSYDGLTALHAASRRGYLRAVQTLLGAKSDLDQDGSYPLHAASENGYPQVVTTLLNAHANINRGQPCSPEAHDGPKHVISCLYLASQNGRSECVDLLLRAGATNHINKGRSPDNVTPLMIAAFNGHYRTAHLLILFNADPRCQDTRGKRAIDYAEKPELKQLLSSGSKNFAVPFALAQARAQQLFVVAAQNGDLATVELLCPNINAPVGAEKVTALHQASQNGHLANVRFLLTRNADPNVRDAEGNTPLIQACLCGNLSIAEFLLGAKAHLDAQDNEGATGLLLASQQGYSEIVDLLVDAHADVNVEAEGLEGTTALHQASQYNRPRIVEKLLTARANMHVHQNDGRTPLMCALNYNNYNCARILFARGARLTRANYERALEDLRNDESKHNGQLEHLLLTYAPADPDEYKEGVCTIL